MLYIVSGKTPWNGYLSVNLGSKNMTEGKNETTVFKWLVIPLEYRWYD